MAIEWLKFERRRVLKSGMAVGATAATERSGIAYAQSKTTSIRSTSDIQVLDPAFRLGPAEDNIMHSVLNKLVHFKPGDPNWKIELEFAEEIDEIDPQTIKFRIKKGVPWSDGFGETTTEDVKYSFERIAGITGLQSDWAGDWHSLKEVEIVDDYTGVIHLKEPFAPLWTTSLPYGSGTIVCKKAVEALAEKRWTTEMPAYNGPYRIREWVPKQRLVLEPNPDWPFDKAPFDELTVIPIEDGKVAELAYLAGELDFTEIDPSSLPEFKGNLPLNTTLVNFPRNGYIWLGMNVEQQLTDGSPGPLQDLNLRRAIQLGVNVEEVLDAAFFGVAELSTGIVAPGLIGHREKRLYGYDPGEARRLIKEGGHEGTRLEIACLNVTWSTTAAQVIAANLGDIGLEVSVTPMDSGTFWTLGFADSATVMTNQLILNDYGSTPDPSFATEWFTPAQIGIWNWERFNSTEFEALNVEGMRETHPEKRHEIYVRMQDLMEESGAYLFLTHGVNAFIYNHAKIIPALSPDGHTQLLRQFKPA